MFVLLPPGRAAYAPPAASRRPAGGSGWACAPCHMHAAMPAALCARCATRAGWWRCGTSCPTTRWPSCSRTGSSSPRLPWPCLLRAGRRPRRPASSPVRAPAPRARAASRRAAAERLRALILRAVLRHAGRADHPLWVEPSPPPPPRRAAPCCAGPGRVLGAQQGLVRGPDPQARRQGAARRAHPAGRAAGAAGRQVPGLLLLRRR